MSMQFQTNNQQSNNTIMSTHPTPSHKSVLTEEVLEYLNLRPGKIYLDVTFGAGGHTRAILEREPSCRVIAMDWDTQALDDFGVPLQAEFGDRLQLIWGNFSLLYKLLKKSGVKSVDGILADFGTSQVQITQRHGFSVYRDTPLDMRMSPSHQRITAAHILATATEEELRQIFWQYGGEGYAKKIAYFIVTERKTKPIETTVQLAKLVERALPEKRHHRVHAATKVFQALRIFVNKELDNISAFLASAVTSLNPEGRLVCISFHSLEDRIVKQFFKDRALLGQLEIITPKVVTASEEELEANPSARSACLRAAERV